MPQFRVRVSVTDFYFFRLGRQYYTTVHSVTFINQKAWRQGGVM
jgi:hypothetical protein